MYLVIKELKPDTDCVIIVTSTLTKVLQQCPLQASAAGEATTALVWASDDADCWMHQQYMLVTCSHEGHAMLISSTLQPLAESRDGATPAHLIAPSS